MPNVVYEHRYCSSVRTQPMSNQFMCSEVCCTSSYEALGRALLQQSFLVRCGTATVAWSGNTVPCGPKRYECPEFLRFTCVPTIVLPKAELDAAAAAMLAAMKIKFTHINTTAASSPKYAGTNNAPIVVVILPRSILDLGVVINRVHKQFNLCGSSVSVTAPNRPDLSRYVHCDGLGHPSDSLRMMHLVRMQSWTDSVRWWSSIAQDYMYNQQSFVRPIVVESVVNAAVP